MINRIIIDPRTQKFVETSANTLNQAIIGATNFAEKYYSDLAKDSDKLSKSLAREGENLSKITRDYLRATHDFLAKQSDPQARRVAEDIAAVNKRIAKSTQADANQAYTQAAKNAHKAAEAFKNAKAAGVAGAAVTISDLVVKANAGDWEGVGQASAGLLGSIAGAKLATAIVLAGLTAFGVTVTAPVALGIVATAAAVGAVAGDSLGKQLWDDLSDHIADQLSKWLSLNRNGKHYFYDPLVLDLDGDGIETLGHNKKLGAMFDFDNDGVKVATGWVYADDGILVFDRNNDGIINNGGELFGDYTDLKDGTKAKHGFNALADLDSNGDGKINHEDEHFNHLKVWQDKNQNGISETDELIFLAELAITALNTSYQDTHQNLDGNNILSQIGSYEKSDGTTGVMGDVNFNFNNLYSAYITDNSLNGSYPNINIKGSGGVPDLAIAITKSAELKQIVECYVLGGKQEQEALLYSLLKAWAMTDPNYKEFDDSIRMSEVVAADTTGAVAIAGTQSATLLVLSDETTKMLNNAKSKVGIIDSFLGTRTDKLYYINENDAITIATVVNDIYNKISSSVYHGLYHQALYFKYASLFDIVIEMNDEKVDAYYSMQTISNEIAQKLSQDGNKAGWALVDALELMYYVNSNHPTIDNSALFQAVHQFTHNKTAEELQVWLDKLSDFAKQSQVLNIGRDGNDYLTGSLAYGHDGNDYIAGKNGTNWLYGGQGNDTLHANQANDMLDGGDGDDHLNGNGGNDILIGGEGNDTLSNYGYNNGEDTYIFSGNYGHDRINDEDWSLGENRHKDTIRFTDVKFDDVRLELGLNNRDLIIHTGDGNSVIIEYAVSYGTHAIERFEFMDKTVLFEELYSAKIATIQSTDVNDVYYFSNWKGEINGDLGNGDDYFQTNTKSTIDGGLGNDVLIGGNLNDVLDGGEGNDAINSGFGNDILIGGEGNDTLTNYGYDNGADTYIFSGNYGHDRINDEDWSLGENRHKDTIRFTDVKFDDVRLELGLNNRDLIIHTGDGNSVIIEYAVNGDSYIIEKFEFIDKTVSFEELYSTKTSVVQGTNINNHFHFSNWKGEINGNLGDGDDYFYASAKSIIDGGVGNDNLNGGGFDDVFIGGLGVDVLTGGYGADSFVFDNQVIHHNHIDKINDFSLSQGDKIDLSEVFDKSIELNELANYVGFEITNSNSILLTLDYDGNQNTFDKKAIAELYIVDNINTTLEQLTQGIGVVL